MTFYSDNPFLFIRHGSIGYLPADIKTYNSGIQFRGGKFDTDCPDTIKALRWYIECFTKRGIKSPIWEEGQAVDELVEAPEPVEVVNKPDNSRKLAEIFESIRR